MNSTNAGEGWRVYTCHLPAKTRLGTSCMEVVAKSENHARQEASEIAALLGVEIAPDGVRVSLRDLD